MPRLIIFPGENEKAKELELERKIITIGSSSSCDVIANARGVKDLHCHITFDGSKYLITSVDGVSAFLLDGRKTWSGILKNGSVVDIGDARLIFVEDIEKEKNQENLLPARKEFFDKVVNFSEMLMSSFTLDDLLEKMMDYIVKMTRADSGFLLLFDRGKIKLKSASGIKKEDIRDSIDRLSDTIIARVVNERKAVIISDAVSHEEFRNAESVVNLNLHSVMCVPLLMKDRLLGIIYLGSQNLKNLFRETDLEVLKIFSSQAALLIYNAMLLGELRAEHAKLIDKLGESVFGELIGNSGAMQAVFREIKAIAKEQTPVLIMGEEGTEKESVAYTIHRESGKKGEFAVLKAGIYNDIQLDVELSGVVKGGLPGAIYPKKGKVHHCKNGTLYIEDVEKLPAHIQMKVLGLIREGIITRIGSATPEKVEVRLILSSVDLESAVKNRMFDKELYTELSRLKIRIPPLRERKEDIELLASHFLDRFNKQYGKQIAGFLPEAIKFLKTQDWPGNLSEFESRIRRAVLMCQGEFITVDDMEV